MGYSNEKNSEELLYTKATSHSQAKRLQKFLPTNTDVKRSEFGIRFGTKSRTFSSLIKYSTINVLIFIIILIGYKRMRYMRIVNEIDYLKLWTQDKDSIEFVQNWKKGQKIPNPQFQKIKNDVSRAFGNATNSTDIKVQMNSMFGTHKQVKRKNTNILFE